MPSSLACSWRCVAATCKPCGAASSAPRRSSRAPGYCKVWAGRSRVWRQLSVSIAVPSPGYWKGVRPHALRWLLYELRRPCEPSRPSIRSSWEQSSASMSRRPGPTGRAGQALLRIARVSAGGAIVAAALLTGLVTATAAGPVLRALPEPADIPDKITYRSLVTPGFLVLCGGLAAAAAAISWHSTPLAAQPLWTVLSTVGILLAAIDARTTWLPLRLTQIAWLLMVLGALAAIVLGAGWPLLTRGGFGFGDVRFAPLLGAAAGADSWRLLLWALFLGTAVGGIHGLVRLARSRAGPFPYAPSMLAGAYLALAASWLYT